MVTVHVNSRVRRPVPRELLRRAVLATLAVEGRRMGELSVTVVGERAIAALNRRYLGRRGPTDVIAFALHDPGAPVLGDVYVGYDQALRQAAELGVEPAEELVRLAVHGTLHVLGYDHAPGPERAGGAMGRRQEALVRRVMAQE